MITDPLFYLLAVPAVLALGLSKGGFAGVGLLATPLVSVYLHPLEAAALLLPILICQDTIAVWWYRHDWDAWNLKVLLPGAVIGMAIGWLLAARVSDDAIRLMVGFIGIAFVAHAWLRKGPVEPQKKTAASGVFWGGVSGFTSFMTQGGGPPVFRCMSCRSACRSCRLVGTTTIFFAVVNALKIGPYFALGQFSLENFATSVVLLPLAVRDQFHRHLAGAGDADGVVLQDRLCAGAFGLAGADLAGAFRQEPRRITLSLKRLIVTPPLTILPASVRGNDKWRKRPTTSISTAIRPISSR